MCLGDSSKRVKQQYKRVRNQSRSKLRQMFNSWWDQKAQEIQDLADRKDMKGFYDALRHFNIGESGRRWLHVVKSITGEMIADAAYVLDRWSAHFESVLNRDSVVLPETIGAVPLLRIRDELMDVPSVDEVWRSIAKLKNGKSAGMDGIPGEIWKYGGEVLLNRLHTLIVDVWESEEVRSGRWYFHTLT